MQKSNVGQKPPPNNHSHYQGIQAIEKLSDIFLYNTGESSAYYLYLRE